MPYTPPISLASELQAWNNGNGAEIETIARVEGTYRLSVSYSTLFWPRFTRIGRYILREGASPEALSDWESHLPHDPRGVESVMNHIHLTDYFMHPDERLTFNMMEFLMRQLHDMHEAKLARDFPDDPCRVVSQIPDDPDDLDGWLITFWQRKWEGHEG